MMINKVEFNIKSLDTSKNINTKEDHGIIRSLQCIKTEDQGT